MNRKLSFIDRCVGAADDMLKTLAGGTPSPQRPSPSATQQQEESLSDAERRHAAGLMRVNHSGEVCAQALYRGQFLTAKSDAVRQSMQQAAEEEQDHLAWCEERLNELNSHTSYLNPLWYGLSFSMGALTGVIGDRLSLGFVAATEQQVCKHLESHQRSLPEADVRSRAIVGQMIDDEARHAEHALAEGGLKFPGVVKSGMTAVSGLMTRSTYRL